jgi:STE24 endopeptidase
VLQVLAQGLLEKLNRARLRSTGREIPEAFRGFVDAARLERITAYTLENSRSFVLQEVVTEGLFLTIILSGFLPGLIAAFTAWRLSTLVAAILFFLLPAAFIATVELGFDYYHTFVIEEKYAFNRSTRATWWADRAKTAAIALLLLCALLTAVLTIMRLFPHSWWFWGAVVVFACQVLLVAIYPLAIAPWFNRFEPLRDDGLRRKVEQLMACAGIPVTGVLQMDAGRRSRHTNAYLTGLGRSKRIVLFDSLVESHPSDEVLAVLAHEIGHHCRHHIAKQLAGTAILLFGAFYLTYRLVYWEPIYESFGFATRLPYVGLFLASMGWQRVGFFLQPAAMALSRRFEREADRFALGLLPDVGPFITTLKRLAADNLANLNPHPLYVWFNDSHPPLAARVAELERWCRAHGPSQARGEAQS